MYLPQLCKTHRTRRVIADPVKKAMDAEYLRTLLPKLTSNDAMAPGASPIPENGASSRIPGSWLPKGPDYRGYGGGELPAPSPVSGSDIPPPLEKSPKATSSTPTMAQGPSTSKRPFFSFIVPTPSATTPSGTPSGTQSIAEVGGPVPSTESTATAPALSLDQASESLDVSWQHELTKLPDHHQLNEEDQYLYETYFH